MWMSPFLCYCETSLHWNMKQLFSYMQSTTCNHLTASSLLVTNCTWIVITLNLWGCLCYCEISLRWYMKRFLSYMQSASRITHHYHLTTSSLLLTEWFVITLHLWACKYHYFYATVKNMNLCRWRSFLAIYQIHEYHVRFVSDFKTCVKKLLHKRLFL